MVQREPLDPVGSYPLPLADGARIFLIGDSNTAGSRLDEPRSPFGDWLQAQLGGRATIVNLGVGGQTVADARRTRPEEVSTGDVVVVMLGTNDAAPRGFLANRRPVAMDLFRKELEGLITDYRDGGSQVLVLAPPPTGSAAMERRIVPYRDAVSQIAIGGSASFLDPAAAFAAPPDGEVLLQYDALHLNDRGHEMLGKWLAEQFVAPP